MREDCWGQVQATKLPLLSVDHCLLPSVKFLVNRCAA